MLIKKNALPVIMLGLSAVASVHADDARNLGELRATTRGLIESLVEQGALTRHKADELLKQIDAQEPPPAGTAVPAVDDPSVVRVPYVPETVKKEIIEEIKKDVIVQGRRERWSKPGPTPDWINRFRLEGDFRLRYHADRFEENNFPFVLNTLEINRAQDISRVSAPFLNTTEDRDRFRLRARLNLLAEVTDNISAGFRLTTGNNTDPVSTNQTLGNTGNRYSVMFDQAYLKADPYAWLTIVGGRVPNPWFGTDLVWDIDLNFDGVAVLTKPKIRENFTPFFTIGAFPLQEVELSSRDKWLYGAQLGADWGGDKVKTKFGVAYYDYRNITGVRNALNSHLNDFTAPQFVQKGNTLFNISQDAARPDLYALAAEFREINVTAMLDIGVFDPVHVIFTADYVKNLAFDQRKIAQKNQVTNSDPGDEAYMVKIDVGHARIKDRHDWQAFAGYKYLESDAVFDAFTDSDFYLGGTNAQGWILGANYGVAKNTWCTLRWMSANEIKGPPLGIDVLFLDLNVKF
ncbi:MAG: putative porin [Pseudomonadota bacterium]